MSESKHTPIPGYPGYEASPDGRIFSTAHNWRGYGVRALSQRPDPDGYPSVRLAIDEKRRRITVHKLIAITFLSPQPSLEYEVRHLDGDKLNSTVSNLAWGTTKENADDREEHGHTSRGATHSRAIKQGLERRGFNVKW